MVIVLIDGCVWCVLVIEGVLVGEDLLILLICVEQIDLIYVNFFQLVGEVVVMQWVICEGQVKGVVDKDIVVCLVLVDGSEYLLVGELLFFDLVVDFGIDIIVMCVLFCNLYCELLFGGYVQVCLQCVVNLQVIIVLCDVLICIVQFVVVKVVNLQGVVEDVEVCVDILQGCDWIISCGFKGGECVIVENVVQYVVGFSVQVVVCQLVSVDVFLLLVVLLVGQ